MSVASANRIIQSNTDPATTPIVDFRRTRQIKRNVRLHKQIKDLIATNPNCRYVGGNHAVESIAAELGFAPHDMAIVDVRIGRRLITLIVLPHRIWDRPHPAAMAIDLRFQAREAGYAAILVPQGVVEREPRLGNSQLLARTMNVAMDATSRMTILAHLIENGPCCLSELAGVIDHVDPFGVVLKMVTTGSINLNIDQPITPCSMIDIANPTLWTRH